MNKPLQEYNGQSLPAGMSPDAPRFNTKPKQYNTLYCDNCGQWCTTQKTSCECQYCHNGRMS